VAFSAKYYYWNLESGEVGWRSPGHPKAIFSRPASELRILYLEKGKEPPNPFSDKSSSKSSSGRDRDRDRDRSRGGRDRDRDRDRDRHHREKDRRRRGQEDELDPMDPASYSDIPRYAPNLRLCMYFTLST